MQLKVLVIVFSYIFLPAYCSIDRIRHHINTDYELSGLKICQEVAEIATKFRQDVRNVKLLMDYRASLVKSMKNKVSLYMNITNHKEIDDLKREIKLTERGLKLEDISKISTMYLHNAKNYFSAEICTHKNDDLCKDPLKEQLLDVYEAEEAMGNAENLHESLFLWNKLRRLTNTLKDGFVSVVSEEKKFAGARGYNNPVDYEQDFYYNTALTIEESKRLWAEVEPLYNELHKYVRRKLKTHYGNELDISDGLLPAHVLGSNSADNWYNIEKIVRPFPNVSIGNWSPNPDLRVIHMFRMANQFFQSLGLDSMESAYTGRGSMITKPDGDKMISCAPTATDFCDGRYKINVCGQNDFDNFFQFYELLGQIQYFMQYKDLPYLFRESASPELFESIGQSIALAGTSPWHLRKLALISDYQTTYESSINHLMRVALIKVALLPFQLIAGLWKWEIASKTVHYSTWNALWWEYRRRYQKIKSPQPSENDKYFDPIINYNIFMKVNLLPEFRARIMEFQIYRYLCIISNEYNPNLNNICHLHTCNFFDSKKVGDKLKAAMSLGSSKDWPDVLEILSGQPNITAKPLLEYFHPLYEFLKEENAKNAKPISPPISASEISCIVLAIFFSLIIIAFMVYTCICAKCPLCLDNAGRWIRERWQRLIRCNPGVVEVPVDDV